VAALASYDNNEFDEALKEFEKVSDTSKILFNMGVSHATLGEHEKAVRLAFFISPSSLFTLDPRTKTNHGCFCL